MRRIGLREANQRFSQTMKAVKSGEEVVLTERGKPVAVIKPLMEKTGMAATIARLEAEGLLRAPTRKGPMPRFRPRAIKGAPLSETLRQERHRR